MTSEQSEFVPVRELEPSDEAALARFLQDNDVPETTKYFWAFPLDAITAARLCGEPRRDRFFVITRESEIVALGMLRGWDEGYEVPSYGVLVSRHARGQRLGQHLTAHALVLAEQLGCERVRLTADPSNAAMVQLARRMGFQAAEELPKGRLLFLAELKKNRPAQ